MVERKKSFMIVFSVETVTSYHNCGVSTLETADFLD